MTTNISTRLMDRRARFVARRHQRRRTTLLGAVACSAACAGFWWIATGPALTVRHVSISGYTQPDQAAVVEAIQVGAVTGDALHLPVQRIRAALADSPWVEDVAVAHDWPRGVSVRITQATPAAIVTTASGERLLVSGKGRVLGPVGEDPVDLPVMTVDRAAVGESLIGIRRAPVTLAAALSPDVRGAVRDLRVRAGVLAGRLDADGTELRFGKLTDLWRKGRALDALLSTPTSQGLVRKAAYVDLSNAERPVLGGLPADALQGSTRTGGSESSGGQPSTNG